MDYRNQYLQMIAAMRKNRETGAKPISDTRRPGLAAKTMNLRPLDRPKFDPQSYMEDIQKFFEDMPEEKETLRPKARPEELTVEPTRPEARPYEIPSEGNRDDFLNRLIMSESSGDPSAEITIKDGRKFVGLGQFGEARLKDFKNATGMEFTQQEFQQDPELQMKVMQWHIREIDKVISQIDPEGQWDRNGLRAVAHLGGTKGMKNYVTSGGKYNPEDELGTSLQDYYNKFSV